MMKKKEGVTYGLHSSRPTAIISTNIGVPSFSFVKSLTFQYIFEYM